MEKKRSLKGTTIKDVEDYKKAQEALLGIFNFCIISPVVYKKFFEAHNLNELIPKVKGWIGICENCFSVLQPKPIAIGKLNTKECEKTKPNQKCYLTKKRCRDVKVNGRKCRNLGKELKEELINAGLLKKDADYNPDPISKRYFFFFREYSFTNQVKENQRYCSPECKKKAHNSRSNLAFKLKN